MCRQVLSPEGGAGYEETDVMPDCQVFPWEGEGVLDAMPGVPRETVRGTGCMMLSPGI